MSDTIRRAWVFQDDKMLKAYGADACAWYVGWRTPEGKRRAKSCGKGAKGKRDAARLADKIHSQLVTGTYEDDSQSTWADFRQRYETTIIDTLSHKHATQARLVLNRFEEIVRPGPMRFITTEKIDRFIAERQKAKGTRGNATLSEATLRQNIVYIRSALMKAHEWGLLPKMPTFRRIKPMVKLKPDVTPEHFVKLYDACDVATKPDDIANVTPADWWRALLMFAYCTGWRITAILSLKWEHVDLDEGTILSRAEDNKGKRDAYIAVPTVVIDHLRRIRSFEPCVFSWSYRRATLWEQFHELQDTADVKPDAIYRQERYGFHDLRRGFATQNHDRISPARLQELMQHRDPHTTKRYINEAKNRKPSADDIFVPDLPTLRIADHA